MTKEPLFTTKQAAVLGLSKLELEILNVAHTESTILQMSKLIQVPRTTLYLHTKNLCARNFLSKIKKGKKFVYRTVSKSDIASSLLELSVSVSSNASMQIPQLSTGIQLFRGKKELSEAWLRIGNQPVGSTIIGIQPTKSLEYSISKVPHNIVRKNHKNIIERNIFMEGYCEQDMYSTIVQHLNSMDELTQTLPDFENRKAITYLFNIHSFNTTSEIFILSEGILLTDWKDEFGILIENTQIGRIIQSLLHHIKPTLKIGNYTEEMRKALAHIA